MEDEGVLRVALGRERLLKSLNLSIPQSLNAEMGRMGAGSMANHDAIARAFRSAQAGQRIAGIAHNVNNSLGAILAYADLLDTTQALSEGGKAMLREMTLAVRRVSDLMVSLAEIAVQDRPDVRMVEVGVVFERLLALIRHDINLAQAAVETRIEEGPVFLVVDVRKLMQVLLHLATNAAEALADSDDVEEPRVIRLSARDAGEAIEIAVWNSAGPVPEEYREAMFEPFFTTKNHGASGANHLGLGLCVARDMTEELGGRLCYEGERGFVVRLNKPGGA